MKTVHLKYTAVIVGEIAIEIPDDTADEYRDAVRVARQTQPHLRAAQFEMVEVKESDDESQTTAAV